MIETKTEKQPESEMNGTHYAFQVEARKDGGERWKAVSASYRNKNGTLPFPVSDPFEPINIMVSLLSYDAAMAIAHAIRAEMDWRAEVRLVPFRTEFTIKKTEAGKPILVGGFDKNMLSPIEEST